MIFSKLSLMVKTKKICIPITIEFSKILKSIKKKISNNKEFWMEFKSLHPTKNRLYSYFLLKFRKYFIPKIKKLGFWRFVAVTNSWYGMYRINFSFLILREFLWDKRCSFKRDSIQNSYMSKPITMESQSLIIPLEFFYQ